MNETERVIEHEETNLFVVTLELRVLVTFREDAEVFVAAVDTVGAMVTHHAVGHALPARLLTALERRG